MCALFFCLRHANGRNLHDRPLPRELAGPGRPHDPLKIQKPRCPLSRDARLFPDHQHEGANARATQHSVTGRPQDSPRRFSPDRPESILPPSPYAGRGIGTSGPWSPCGVARDLVVNPVCADRAAPPAPQCRKAIRHRLIRPCLDPVRMARRSCRA